MENQSTRQKKVAREVLRYLSEIFREKGGSTFNGAMISVTDLHITPDLSVARVYLSIFPPNKVEEVFKLVQQNNKMIRGELGRKVSKQLRIVPELIFKLDDSLDYVERIDELLKK